MTEPKRINPTYIGGELERVIGTYTSESGVVHGVKYDDGGEGSGTYRLCGWARWEEFYGSIPDYDKSGKASDVTCKRCLRSLKKR